MEFAALGALAMAFISFPGLLIGLLLIGLGYVLRKFVEKRWPNEAALVDAVGTRYGKKAEAQFEKLQAEFKVLKDRI